MIEEIDIMNRRTYLKTIVAGSLVAAARSAETPHPIQLHCDLSVDPAKEKQMLHHFETVFKPAAAKFPGFVDVKMIKLRSALMGKAPAGLNYRFVLNYQSEELRQKWIASDTHQKVWPPIENTLADKNYTVLLFDVAS
jgi:hypothetical protein